MSIIEPLKFFLIVLLAGPFILSSCSSSQSGTPFPANTPQPAPEATANVDLCELLEAPDKYEQKSVRVKGYLCDCFEDGSLYPANCSVQKKIWVEGSLAKCDGASRVDGFRQATASEPESRYGAWTFGIIAIGRLTGTKGGYGQMNQYDLLFKIDCVEHAELLDRTGKKPAEMTEQQQRNVAEFERLK